MCGISGYLDLNNGVRPEVLRRMNDVITHRGPDDEGYALMGNGGTAYFRGRDTIPEITLPPLEQANGPQYFLGFGHRRLSILDLSASGHQPMALPGRDIVVTYNGEIYNFIELRDELTALGYTFRTTCDTEILLYAYLQWGEECLTHFNGMWGFALWDGEQNKLFCARDRLGAKPFHYWRQGNRLLFGSELKQLCQDDSVSRHFDQEYMMANLVFSHSDFSDQTLIQDFHLLQPGHKLTVQLSTDRREITSFTVAPYWTLNTDYLEGLSLEEWKERVAAEFSRACRWRLRSDAPLSALLSGGLDSSCLVTEVCGQLSSPSDLETFTTSYPGRADCDEWKFADMVNKACGCHGNQFLPDPQEGIEQLFEKCLWHTEGLMSLSFLGPMLLLEDISKKGYKVVLNGQCGDETMFGYSWYYAFFLADLLRKGKAGEALKTYREITQHSALSALELAAGFVYYNSPTVRTVRKMRTARTYIREEALSHRNPHHAHQYLCASSLKDVQLMGLTYGSLPTIVRNDDRMYMSASLESRLPFMDYQFVELAAQIPPELKIHNGYTKSIMREIFDSRMPKEVTWRTDKMGFKAPTDRWAGRFSQEYLMEQVKNAKTAAYFKTDALAHMVETKPSSPEIFQFLQMEQFARQFGVS